jgi:hypothetical protein
LRRSKRNSSIRCDERLRFHDAEIKLLDRDGKTADQPCDRFQILAVLAFEQSGEPLNAFVVAVQKRFAIDLNFNL